MFTEVGSANIQNCELARAVSGFGARGSATDISDRHRFRRGLRAHKPAPLRMVSFYKILKRDRARRRLVLHLGSGTSRFLHVRDNQPCSHILQNTRA